MNTAELRKAIKALPFGGTNDARAKYAYEIGLLEDQWTKWLVENFAQGINKPDPVFAMAWGYGHSEGYQSVQDIFDDLCDLVRATR